MKIEDLISEAFPDLREIVFHSDGKVIAKTGGHARFPKKLYTGHGKNMTEMITNALIKLINDNKFI